MSELSKNAAESRFELRVDGELVGLIDYRPRGEAIDLYHTEVDPAHGGKGYGQELVRFALDDARVEGYRVVPTCPFIARYLERHLESRDLVAG